MKDAQIEIVPSHHINKMKWNACINNSSNRLIYATSFYLDHITDNWHGIVVNDYDCVLPVAWRKKYGIRYCYEVPFTQQLGWFQQQHNIVSKAILLKKLFSFSKYGDYTFNFKNAETIDSAVACNNYVLDLSRSYNEIKNYYTTDLLNNLKKANKENFIYAEEGSFETVVDLYQQLYQSRTPHVSNKDFQNFKTLCTFLVKQKNVIIRKVCNGNNELLSTTLLLKHENRLYNMMNSTTAAGRKTEANHFLFDCIFREFAGRDMLFDFEGSNIPGIKKFYEKFGAVNQPYFKMHFNQLPFPLKMLKH
ncbi:MAG TPA: hypothetical protein PLA68_02395 [Panacibacter sp.]|nr:hypothetical protein [Panacibacter sp.]